MIEHDIFQMSLPFGKKSNEWINRNIEAFHSFLLEPLFLFKISVPGWAINDNAIHSLAVFCIRFLWSFWGQISSEGYPWEDLWSQSWASLQQSLTPFISLCDTSLPNILWLGHRASVFRHSGLYHKWLVLSIFSHEGNDRATNGDLSELWKVTRVWVQNVLLLFLR